MTRTGGAKCASVAVVSVKYLGVTATAKGMNFVHASVAVAAATVPVAVATRQFGRRTHQTFPQNQQESDPHLFGPSRVVLRAQESSIYRKAIKITV